MLARAHAIKSKHNKSNVTFVESQITDMSAIPSDTADCIISNCVINLVPEAEKPLVFREMHRLLRPGGRVAISDILAKKPLPEKLRANMALYVGCVSGASLVEQYRRYLEEAGFSADSVVIEDDGADLNVYIETNPDGTRTVGGTGGNLCCNPMIATTPAKALSSSFRSAAKTEAAPSSCSAKTAASSCCANGGAEPAAASTSSCCSETKAQPDAAAMAAVAEPSSSCCGGGNTTEQSYAFDEKDLADLEGEDLNTWAGKFHFLAAAWMPVHPLSMANVEMQGHTRFMLSSLELKSSACCCFVPSASKVYIYCMGLCRVLFGGEKSFCRSRCRPIFTP